MGTYILALDQGTTSSRAIVFDRRGDIVSKAQFPFRQLYPQPGWVVKWQNFHSKSKNICWSCQKMTRVGPKN